MMKWAVKYSERKQHSILFISTASSLGILFIFMIFLLIDHSVFHYTNNYFQIKWVAVEALSPFGRLSVLLNNPVIVPLLVLVVILRIRVSLSPDRVEKDYRLYALGSYYLLFTMYILFHLVDHLISAFVLLGDPPIPFTPILIAINYWMIKFWFPVLFVFLTFLSIPFSQIPKLFRQNKILFHAVGTSVANITVAIILIIQMFSLFK